MLGAVYCSFNGHPILTPCLHDLVRACLEISSASILQFRAVIQISHVRLVGTWLTVVHHRFSFRVAVIWSDGLLVWLVRESAPLREDASMPNLQERCGQQLHPRGFPALACYYLTSIYIYIWPLLHAPQLIFTDNYEHRYRISQYDPHTSDRHLAFS